MASKRYKVVRIAVDLGDDYVWLPDGAIILEVSYQAVSATNAAVLEIGNNLWQFRRLEEKWKSGYTDTELYKLAQNWGIIPFSSAFFDGTIRTVIKALVPAPKPREGKYA